MSFAEWKAPDGWAYRRLDWLQPDPAQARGSILFAGGRGDFIEKYIEIYRHWYDQGWNLTAFDWRGQGASRGKTSGGHLDSLDPLVEDLASLVEDWRAQVCGPHVVVGHSMGGHILLRLLVERRPELAAAILVAPMLGLNSAPLPAWLARWLAFFLTLIGAGKRPAWRTPDVPSGAGSKRQIYLTGSRDRYLEELWWWGREPGYNLGAPSWGWLNAAYRSSASLGPRALAKVETPLLLLGTECDRLVSAKAIRRAASLIPGAELLMFKDSGHEILREEDRIRLPALSRIDTFLQSHAPR
ncbi:alpha/beta hydrolase [Sphingosinicella sp. GR2756]|uniref:Alpha/beta hydrolase n=1 Tax=Sphingosinicella rhizophila TaxID=3050082 RepID=A0ABU3Q4W6_9SPHN|nr:alpha/beta hydrolase [Sphingosinicella sp. GR2756]